MTPQSHQSDKIEKAVTCRIHHEKLSTSPFFDLPGEIRNRIYDFVFDNIKVHVCRRGTTQNKESKDNQKKRQASSRFRLQCQIIPYSLCQILSSSLCASSLCYTCRAESSLKTIRQAQILRVCHRMHEEVVPFFYAKTTFRFASMKIIHKFLSAAPRDGIKAIRRLELLHTTYGEPELLRFRQWKERHDEKWMRTCERIAEQMTGITNLKVELRICDWPAQLNLQAAWAKPLLALQSKQDGFEQVEVILRHWFFNESRLRHAARNVAKAMMNDNIKGVIDSTEGMAKRGQGQAGNKIIYRWP